MNLWLTIQGPQILVIPVKDQQQNTAILLNINWNALKFPKITRTSLHCIKFANTKGYSHHFWEVKRYLVHIQQVTGIALLLATPYCKIEKHFPFSRFE